MYTVTRFIRVCMCVLLYVHMMLSIGWTKKQSMAHGGSLVCDANKLPALDENNTFLTIEASRVSLLVHEHLKRVTCFWHPPVYSRYTARYFLIIYTSILRTCLLIYISAVLSLPWRLPRVSILTDGVNSTYSTRTRIFFLFFHFFCG